MIMSTLYRWVKDFSALCTDYDVNVLKTDRGYYVAVQGYEISLQVLKYFFNMIREISYLQAAM